MTPLGFTTYVRLPNGTTGRLYTSYLPSGEIGRTTGKIGGRDINCFASTCY